MGIKGLTKLIADEAPDAIKEHKVEHYNGRIIAVDASMAIYQFLIAIRHGNSGGAAAQLTNEAGEVTSHIQGLFNRTIRMLSSGIKPVFVFDGKPPTLKGGELDKRREKREKAEADLKKAQEEANVEEQDRQNKRLVRAGKKESADCKRLLELMGVPFLDAPCEAEAQCAGLAKISKVFAVATEDTDTLTFATPRLLRNMTSAGDNPIKEIDYKKVLEGLQLTPSQFIDLCILMGCDYTSSIRGIGPKSALNLIKKHGDIETILKHLPKDKFQIPPEWLPRVRVRKEKSAVSSPSSSLPPSLPLSSSSSTEEMPAAGAATAASGEEGGREGEEEAEAVNARETAPDEKEKTVVGEVMEEEAEKAVVENEEEVLVEGAEEGSHGAAEDTAGEDAGEEGKEGEEWEWVDQTPAYVMARTLFSHPEIHDPAEQSFKWTEPNEAGLEEFLIDNLGFNPDRVKSGIAKLKASRGAMQQKRLDSFFKPSGSTSSSSSALKRKEAPAVGKGKGKGKAGGKKR